MTRAAKPWRIWTGATRGSAWWHYGPAYASEAAAIAGVDRRIATGEFRVQPGGAVVTDVFANPVGVGHIGRAAIEVQRRG